MVRELERKRQSAKFPEIAPVANPVETKSKCPSGSCDLPDGHSNISPKSIALNLEAGKYMLPNHRSSRDENVSNLDSCIKTYSAVELSIAQERLRQARWSFNLALAMTAAFAVTSLVGVGLLLSGKTTEGSVAAAGGLASSVRCLQLVKDTNDRLDKIAAEI
ncbi:hypothetical protein [Nostoc sp. JL33]|uniref:TRADD-N-associated membrane domain-containing protein n=2 Tax=Nostoc TaxID=1177 RepID=UPI0025E75EBC|nr:hypothetical protein [Nostoc sp. JL33]